MSLQKMGFSGDSLPSSVPEKAKALTDYRVSISTSNRWSSRETCLLAAKGSRLPSPFETCLALEYRAFLGRKRLRELSYAVTKTAQSPLKPLAKPPGL